MFYPNVSFVASISTAGSGNFIVSNKVIDGSYSMYYKYTDGNLSQSGNDTSRYYFENTYYDKAGYVIRTENYDFNKYTSTDYRRDGSYSYTFYNQGYLIVNISVNADGSSIETSYNPYLDPPEVYTDVYGPGSISVTPQTPYAVAANTATYRVDSSSRVVSLRLPEDNGGFLDVRYDYSGAKATERHLRSDASGKIIEETRYDSEGNLYFDLDINPDGSRTTTHYKNGYFLPSSDSTTYADGSSISHEYGIKGNVISTTTVSVDGTKIKSFVAADGLHTNTYKNGSLALAEVLKGDGSKTAVVSQKGVSVIDTDGSDLFTSFGQNTFVFSGSGKDTIRNFHAIGDLSDTIKLVDVDPQEFSIFMQGKNTIVHASDDHSITLVGVKITDVIDNILFA